ncbi:hypothetical protein ABXN37_19620 [Piscinibacter sakaiensis]|uniref:Uncharacterized protein n=1 Tax=Piscinibacter sakaiensis TaxID=1547922 RepID=A0A0K8P557_PISS1|nr:hypothetical protein [Piscinibacter sakaiensis]GAP37335.1 hypothetical protein ISF6_3190 [Piscinibacter sakaiensis]
MPDAGPPLHWHEERALWHLELLGCFEPGDAVAPYVPPPARSDDGWDDDDYDDGYACTHCGGEGRREVDDIWWDDCDEFGYGPCTSCRGTGERRHQWVF